MVSQFVRNLTVCSKISSCLHRRSIKASHWTFVRWICRWPAVSFIMDQLHMKPWASCQIRKWGVVHAPGMPGTFSSPPRVSYPDIHHGTCVRHVPWCMPGSLNSGFLWRRWREKCSRHSRHMRNTQFYVSSKRPLELLLSWSIIKDFTVEYIFTLHVVHFPAVKPRESATGNIL